MIVVPVGRHIENIAHSTLVIEKIINSMFAWHAEEMMTVINYLEFYQKSKWGKLGQWGMHVKKEHACLDVSKTHDKVDDMDVLDIFEEEMNKVIHPLANPSIFMPDRISMMEFEKPKSLFQFSHFIESSNLSTGQKSLVINTLSSLVKLHVPK